MKRGNNSGTSACASCKHQRKKCTEKCVLAPFFPANKIHEFQAVQRVFGISNVTKIIMRLKEDDRMVAIDSLVWEALCRQKDPVLGPYGDYSRACEELRLYRAQFQQQQVIHQLPHQGMMGWTNMNMITNGASNNNFHSNVNGANMVDFSNFACSSLCVVQDNEKIGVERENGGSALVMPQQNLSTNTGFNQQYFLAGQYNPMDSKSMESTLWEGSS